MLNEMKRIVSIMVFCLLVVNVWAQTNPVKIVFDVTSANEDTHKATMRHVKMMSQSYPDSKFEVVIYGGAMTMALADKSSVAEEIRSLKDNPQVSIKVCEGTMKRNQVNASQLLPGVVTVADGILEIVTRQSEGWGYIKEAHN